MATLLYLIAGLLSMGLSQSIANSFTTLISERVENPLSSISLFNSSSSLLKLHLIHSTSSYLVSISKTSEIVLKKCFLDVSNTRVPFSSFGSILLSEFSYLPTGQTYVESLVNNNLEGSSVEVEKSRFSDFPIPKTEGTFVSSGNLKFQKVDTCQFINVTTINPSATPSDPLFASVEKCNFENTFVESCEDTFYGRFVAGESSKTRTGFSCLNNTFLHCTRVTNPSHLRPFLTNTDFYTKQWAEGSDGTEHNYADCYFKHAETESAQGGALYSGGNDNKNKMFISRCKFEDCSCKHSSSSYGGGCFLQYFMDCQVYNTEFTRCEVHHGTSSNNNVQYSQGGGMYINNINYLKVTGCTFDTCKAGRFGGGLYLWEIKDIYNQKDTLHSVYQCEFKNCEADHSVNTANKGGWGGGLFYHDITNAKSAHCPMTIGKCTFESCSAPQGYGGGVFFQRCGDLTSGSIVFDCTFSGNSALRGSDAGFLLTGTITQSPLSSDCSSTTDSVSRVYVINNKNDCSATSGTEIKEYSDTGIIYVKNSPGSDSTCYDPTQTQCVTLSQAFSKDATTATGLGLGALSTSPISIYYVDKSAEQVWGSVTVENYFYEVRSKESGTTLTLKESDTASPFVTVTQKGISFNSFTLAIGYSLKTGQSLFSIGGGALTLNSMTISSNLAYESADSQLKVTGGTVSCTNCIFSNLKSKSPLIAGKADDKGASLSALTFSTVRFENIRISTADKGAVLDTVVPTAGLDLRSVTFHDCGRSSTAAGCAVRAELSAANTLLITAGEGKAATVFTKSTGWASENEPYHGLWIVAEPAILTQDTHLQSLFSTSTWSTCQYQHMCTVKTLTPPLSHVYISPKAITPDMDSIANVAATGADVPGCGWSDLPCFSISLAYQHRPSKQTSITVNDGTYESQLECAINTAITVKGATQAGVKITMSNALFIVTATDKDILIQTMSIVTPAQSFLTNTASKSVTLSEITFGKDEATTIPTGSVIVSSAGILKLDSITAKQLTISGGSFVSVGNGGSLSVGETSANTFEDITGLSGSVISATSMKSATVTIKKSTFTSCLSTGNGGAVYLVVLASSGYVNIGDAATKFDRCSAPGKLGGGIYMEADDITKIQSFYNDITFDNVPATEDKGLCVYYHGTDTDAYLTRDKAKTWKADLASTANYHYMVLEPGSSQLLYDWKSIPEGELSSVDYYVNGETGSTCTETAGCKYLSLAIEAANAADKTIIRVKIVENKNLSPETEGMSDLGTDNFHIKKSYTLQGLGSNTISVSRDSIASSGGIFLVSSSTLAVKSLAFNIKSGSTVANSLFKLEASSVLSFSSTTIKGETSSLISATLIDASSSTLKLNDVEFTSITLENCPLLTVTPTVDMSGASFTSITRQKGNGAVLSVDLTSTSTTPLTVAGTYKDCMCESGFGVLYFTIAENTPASSISAKNAKFVAGESNTVITDFRADSYNKGNAPFGFHVTDLKHFTQSGTNINLPLLFPDYNADLTVKRYYAQVSTSPIIIPLKYFLDAPTGTAFYIEKDGVPGNTFPTCGSEYLPCNAVKDAYDRITEVVVCSLYLGAGLGYASNQLENKFKKSVVLLPKSGEVSFALQHSDSPLVTVSTSTTATHAANLEVSLELKQLTFTVLGGNENGFGKLIRVSNGGSFKVTNCKFNGMHSTGSMQSNSDPAAFCSWEGYNIEITDATTVEIVDTTFANMTEGALKISKSPSVSFKNPTFETNRKGSLSDFPYKSYSRNVLCDSSALTLSDIETEKAKQLWIYSPSLDCTVAGQVTTLNQAYFQPELGGATAALTPQQEQLTVKLSGTRLIPCHVYMTLRIDEHNYNSGDVIPHDGDEESATITVTGELYSKYVDGSDVRVAVAYGPDATNQAVSNYIILKRGAAELAETPSEGGLPTYVIIIIAGVGFLLLLILLIIIICCCCCRKRSKEDENDDLMEEKDEELPAAAAEAVPTVPTQNPVSTSLMVEGIEVKAPHTRVLADVKNSLFSRIHTEPERQSHNPFAWSAEVATDVAEAVTFALSAVYGPDGRKVNLHAQQPGKNELSVDNLEKLVNTLSPHSMLFTEDGELTLSVVPPSVYIFIFPDSEDSDSFQNEVRRYKAPEAQRRDTARTRQEAEAAAVYALGLLIYEVFTGWVPFNGYSANEASEMMCNGMRPDTAQISQVDSSFSDLIAKCVSQEPAERPTLADVKKRLALYLPASARAHYGGLDDSGDDL